MGLGFPSGLCTWRQVELGGKLWTQKPSLMLILPLGEHVATLCSLVCK